MADPEQIYSEVLQEEQAKGSASAVAEGRAKAARVRTEHGSPHPKEPRWWPGSQPRWEGGGDGAEAPAAEEPAEEIAEEAPAAEAPAAEPVAEPVAEPQAAPAAAAEPAPAAQPAAVATAAPAAAATTTELAPEMRPAGVAPGTATGNRLRPEDSVGTDAQFDAERAVAERRRLIDEVVATGVPAAAAAEPRRGGGIAVLLVYLLIVGLGIGFVVANQDELGGGAEASEAGGEAEGGEGGAGGGPSIGAANVQFDTDTLELPAGEESELVFTNDDSVEHNVAIYDEEGGEEIFKGDIIPGGQETTYSVPALDEGEYYFQCDVHPAMNGTVTVG